MSENKQDITQLRQRLAQSNIIVDATRRFTSTLDFDEIRLALFEAASQIVGAQQMVLHLLNEQELQSYICYPMEGLRIETAVLPSDATAYRICREVEPVIWYRDDADQSALPIGVEVIDKFDSYLALPLKGADHVVGVIEAFNLLEPQNAAQQIDLLAEIAGSAGLALYNGMLYQEAQQSRQSAQEYLDMQNVLHEINIELFRIDDLDELYRSAVELAHTRLGFDRVGMFLLNETKDLLLGTYGVDVEGNICDEKGPEYIIDQKETIDAFVLNRTRLMVTEDIDLWYSGEVVGRGWHIGAAMWIEESPIGVIFADNLLTGRPLKPYQSELLFAYAGVVSNLIQRNRFETIITNRAIEMQAVAEVGTAAATILDTDKLLQEVVDLTKNRFDLYHAHIYLLDKTTETLVLTSGAGKIGQQMVAEGRQIPLNQEQSLVARAARSRQGVVINDVKSEPGFLPHPLLPDTRSEMAVPLITGDQVLGVLDVQSDRLNYFSKEDISTFTTLAAQMAVALQNARLFTESEKRASELAFISRIVTEINVSDIETGLQFMAEELGEILQVPLVNVRLIDETGNMLKIAAARHPAEVPSPVGTVFPITKDPVNDALQARQTVIIEDVANAKMPPHTQKRLLEAGIQSVYMIPMAAGRDLIGSIAMSIMEGSSLLTPEQLKLAETTVQQVATAVQNTRLFTKSEERAEELALVNKVVAEVSASLDIEQSLQIVADELAKVVDLEGIGIALLNDDKTSLTVVAEHYSSEEAASILGYTYPIAGNPVTQKAFSTRNTVLVEDAQNHPLTEPIHAGLRMRGVNTMYVIPMFAGNEIVGTIGFDSKEKGRLMSPQQLRLVETIVYQVATAVQTTRQYDAIKRSQESLRRSEAELSEALKIAKLAYWEYDAEKDIFTFNDQFFALFHTTAEEHGGHQLPSAYYAEHFVYPDDLPLVGAEIERALNSTDRHYNRSLEHRILYADGGVGYISVSINIERDEQGNILRYYGANQDITERKEAEESLRRSEAELSEALKIAKLAYWEYDVENDLFTFNDQFFALFHTTAEEHGGHQLPSAYYAEHFVYPDDLPLVGTEIERALNSTDRHYNRLLEHRILYADGGVGYITVNINIDRDEQGNILRYYGANQDITERKQAEEALAKQARELQIVSELSTAVATTREQEKLLQEVVDLTRERFDFYHAQIYLFNAQRDTLILEFGAGDVGRELVAQEHRIPLNAPQSLVARAARSGQAVVVNDVRANPDWLPNELLPETQAEMAVPMMVGDQVVGVLDVQSGSVDRFTDQDVQIQTTLAAQAAVAFQNARLFTQSEERTRELAFINRIVTEINVSDIETGLQFMAEELGEILQVPLVNVRLIDETGNMLKIAAARHPAEVPSPVGTVFPITKDPVNDALQARQTVIIEDVANAKMPPHTQKRLLEAGIQSVYMIPMAAGRDLIGSIAMSIMEGSSLLTPEQLKLAETTVQQVATAVQNTRLFTKSEVRAEELATVANVSTVAATILDPDELLHQVVDLTKERFNLYHAHIYLLDEDLEELVLTSGAGEVGRAMVAEGRYIALGREKSLVARAARDKKGVVINDVQAEPDFLPHPLLPETRAEMAVPLLARDEVLGVLDVQADTINRFGEEDVNIFTMLAVQIAIALQNARFLNQSEKAVKELQELSRRLTREGWQEYFTQRKDKLAFGYDQQQKVPVSEVELGRITFPKEANLITQPLQIQGEPVGQLRLEISEQYGKDESELLTAVTERLSAHLENLRLAEASEKDRAAAEKRSQEMAVINNIVTQISTSLDLQHSLQIVVDELVTAVNVDQARVALIQPNRQEMLVIAEHYDASRATSAVGMAIPLVGNELTQKVIQSRQMVIVKDAQNSPETAPVHDLFREQGIQTVILIPLVVNDEVIGTLGMDILDDRPIQEDGLKLAETIVFQTATAIQNARLFEQVQATLAETEMLYSYSSQLNTATSLDAVLEAAAAAGFEVGATEALLLVYDRNTTGNPEYAQIASTAPREETRVGEILYLQEQPTRYLWPASGQNTVFVGDVSADDRLSPEDKKVFAQQKVKALGIMYLNVGNLRLGQIVIYWDKVQTFTNADERLYGAIAQQASSVVYNRLLFNQTEEALSETAALYQASADLNTAQTFDEVLTALRQHTIFGQNAHSVTISYFDRPWDKDDLPEDVIVLAGWGAGADSEQPNRFKVDALPGFLDLLSHDELQVHEDVVTDERIREEARVAFVENLNVKAMVYAPLIVGSRRLGFINGYYPESMSFTEENLRRLNVLTRQAAVTIQSIRLYEQTQEALAQTEALYTGSERIILASTEDEILQSLIQSTELRRLDRASLYMFDHPVEDRNPSDVSVVATWVNEGIPPSVQVGTRFEVARVPFLSTVNPDESLVINDIRNDPRVDERTRQILESYGMISFVMVPVVVGSQWLGMVSGQSSMPMNMTDVQMRQANSLVGQAAVVMQTTILFRQEQARARREHLLREIAAKVRSSTDIDTIMQTAVTEIGRTLGRRSFIKLGNGQNGDAKADMVSSAAAGQKTEQHDEPGQ